MKILKFSSETETLNFAEQFAKILNHSCFITLSGQLGSGKTTFTRGVLQALGHKGNVKSPTYTLVELYNLEKLKVFHFDLYRIQDQEELELMGIRDYFGEDAIILLEWPEYGADLLPVADINCSIQIHGTERIFKLFSHTAKGQNLLQRIK